MKLKIFGGGGEVTGSNYMLDLGSKKILIDCGSHQGSNSAKHENEIFEYDASEICALLVTHAHIDHSGKIPLLVKRGFKGNIFCTYATAELLPILLHDSAKIMAEDAQWQTRKNARKGLPAVEPLYTEKDVDKALEHIVPVAYDEVTQICDGVSARFREAGHILGSAIIETWLAKNDGTDDKVKVVFSGDLGQKEGAIEKPPTVIEDADFALIESTYGDRKHKSLEETRSEFQAAMEEAISSGGKVLVPTFVVDRAQRMLYEFKLLEKKYEGRITKMPKIYLDSPMGVKTTEIYSKYAGLLAKPIRDMLLAGEDPFEPGDFKFVRTSEESRAVNDVKDAVVLAGGGMCAGGRILHHIKNNAYKKSTHIFFVGYQAYGTLGRRIVDGAKTVRIGGEPISIKAKLHTLNGFSAHADRDDLLEWAEHFPKDTQFIVVHGEPAASRSLAGAIADKGYFTRVPANGDTIDLLAPAPENARMPMVAKQIIDNVQFTGKDIEDALNKISARALQIGEKLAGIQKLDKNTLPLLISAVTLLETVNYLNADNDDTGK
ncbi:MAG: MBL fold metallo-hydrolase [Synergistes sp.]|nr:MBL fold metallo-hydrolase [Synergistes sp.]